MHPPPCLRLASQLRQASAGWVSALLHVHPPSMVQLQPAWGMMRCSAGILQSKPDMLPCKVAPALPVGSSGACIVAGIPTHVPNTLDGEHMC